MYKSKGMKQVNIQLVKDYLIEHKIATKSQISKATKLSLATITNILKELLDSGFITRIEDCESTGGRKAKQYKMTAEFMCFGLIHLQVSQNKIELQFRITNLNQSIIYEKKYLLENLDIATLLSIIHSMYELYNYKHLSISIPGIVDNGYVTKCDIHGLENCFLKEELEKKINIKVSIENDVNIAMLGYINLNSVIGKSIAFVYQPDNHHTGCSLFINGAIVYGSTNFAGELAYLPNGTLQEQEELLIKQPLQLLVKQITSIIAIVNPSDIVLHIPCVNEEFFNNQIKQFIPKKHLPKFVFISSINEFVFLGLQCLCIENSRYKLK